MVETLVFSGVNIYATQCKYRRGAECLIDSSVVVLFLFEFTLYIFTTEKVTLGHSK